MNKVSVIIPTYNGARKIVNALKSLEQQTFRDFETIVVVDGSTDNTEEMLHLSSFKLKSLKIITQDNTGRSKVRNRGAKEADAALLIFMDDDMCFTPHVLEQHIDHHNKYEQSVLSGIPIEDPLKIKSDFQKYRRYLSLSWIEKFNNGLNKLNKQNLFLTAANMSMPKKLFDSLGGFDERLTDAEDKKLGLLALDRGFEVFFNSNIIGWHDDFITCRSYINRRREYEKAQVVANLETPISKFKKIFYFPFAHNFWVYLIDKNFIAKILPPKIRFRFYTYVVWGLSRYFPNK